MAAPKHSSRTPDLRDERTDADDASLRTETPDRREVRLTPDEVRQGHIVLRQRWQKVLVLQVLPVAVLAIVVIGLAIGV